jgi:hypothetical protein
MRSFVVLVVFVLLGLAAPASAQDVQLGTNSVGEAVDAFRAGDPVYVDADVRDELPASQEEGLEEQIRRAGGGIFVAVFPQGAGTPGEIGRQILQGTRQPGTYGVVVGSRFEAGSTDLRRGQAARLAAQAASGNSLSQGLAEFVTSVDEARSNAGGAPVSRGNDESGGGGFLALLGILALAFGVLTFIKSRRRKREDEAQMADVRRVVTDDLAALGADIRALDLDVEMPGVDPEAKQRYGEAVEAYIRAEEALDRGRTPEDFEPIGKELEEGRYDIAAARALLEGNQPPERRPPCFFDPRHGPSVADLEWAPPGGQPRPVPVCAADAVRLEEGEEPMSREIVLGGQRMPYWQAPGQFAPFYAGGMFGGLGGLATGMLFGSMLGGAMYGGWGAGDAYADAGGFGGGDFGGGDFGGGDFGGGDFGGGDFG